MWFQCLLLIFAFTSVIANIQEDVKTAVGECGSRVDKEKMGSLSEMKLREAHAVFCTELGEFFTCLADMAKNEFGLSLEEVVAVIFEPDDTNGAEFLMNFLELLEDVCVEGSQLNTDLMADIDCLDEIDKPAVGSECRDNAEAAYEAYKDLAENVEDIDEDIQAFLDKNCMKTAYEMACAASAIHDTCGRRAFETFNTIVKRTKFFQSELCSPAALEELKTSFAESLEMEDDQKELFRLAFDLRKRKK